MKVIEEIEVINNGGFGIIDKVRCDDGKIYARKTFNPAPQFLSDKDLTERLRTRFIREVKTQKLLPSDLFIPIYFDNLSGDNPWFLMPVAEDVYSSEINSCKTESRPPEGLGDILNSLEFLHSKGLFHRDLKPQNILKHDGVWKLADFGLISQDKEILSQTITTSNNAWGTIYYCAPEQASDFRRVDHLADIYSFGAILHDIFTEGKRTPYSELSADGEIGFIIEKSTKSKKENRFKSVESLRSRLLYVLSKPILKTGSFQDNEWLEDFKEINSWSYDKFEAFLFYLKRNDDFKNTIFYEIKNKALHSFIDINKDLFIELCILYLEWVEETSFQFDYCDVIIGYIQEIYNTVEDLDIKSKAVVAAAELARSHNRWYVMRKVVSMSNPDIDDSLAFRIGVEIDLDNSIKVNFLRCAERINLSINVYHPIIKDILS